MDEKNESGTPLSGVDETFAPPSQPASSQPRSSFHPDVPSRPGIPGAAPSLAGQQQTSSDTIEPNRLIIGREVKLKGGEISACDRLSLEGEVENVNLSKARLLEIAPVGVFKGKAHVDEATIGGRFEGELTANNRLTVKDGGAISGSVRYGSIVIEPGGSISGDMQTLTETSET